MPERPSPFHSPPRAFISYARTDGEAFAGSLRQRLAREQPEITLWQDRTSMEGGIGWWKQITEALGQVESLIMVMTPAALDSEVARKEWRYARQQGVRICPVVAGTVGEFDFGALPVWMRKAHFYDLEREWESCMAFLKSPVRINRVPFMAPDLRGDFVPRPEEFETLLSALLDRSQQNPIAITTALQGAGGFGKTTLAVALCHHEDIITAFDDGILWATLGEQPKVEHELAKLYAALTGERPAFVDADDAAIQLAGRLDQKNCLIVIDDVWDPNHVKPFLRGGHDCARLITTRRLQVVTDVGAQRVLVDEMTQAQSVEMLTARLSGADVDVAALRQLARRLGEWPLLLKLAASQLRERIERGDSLSGALAYVNRALDKRGPVAFDRAKPTSRGDAIASTVAASLDLLSPADRRRCEELAVFPEDRLIPLSATRALWGLDQFDTEELVQVLDGAALVDFDLKNGGIRVHDVLQAYLGSRLGDVRAVHERLVRQGWPDPFALPDGYAWRWFGWHAVQGGEQGLLHSLLLDFRWLEAKLRATDVQALLQDFDLLREADDLRVVQEAIRLASHGLARDPAQLAAQLQGRLERGVSGAVDALLDQVDRCATRPWLVLARPSLTHPGGALVGIMKGHTKSVEAIARTDDGRWIVSGSADWTLRVWSVADGRSVGVLSGHAGIVHCVTAVPGATRVVSGSEDRTLRVWDVETGAPIEVLKGHLGAVTGVAVAPDGMRVASTSDDRSVRLWTLADRRSRVVFSAHSHQVRAVAWMPGGARLALAPGDETIVILDAADGRVLLTLRGHEGLVKALAASRDGRRLLSAGVDRTVRLWDAETGAPLRVLHGHRGEVNSVAFAREERFALSGAQDHTLRLWPLDGESESGPVFEGHASFVTSVTTSADGAQAWSASGDKSIRHWSLAARPAAQQARACEGPVTLLALSADGGRVVTGWRKGTPTVWDAGRQQARGTLDAHTDVLSALWLSADGRRAVTTSRDRTVRVWDVEANRCVNTLRGHLDSVTRLAVMPDGRYAATLSRDRTIRVWDLNAGRTVRALVGRDNERAAAALRPAGPLLEEMEAGPIVDVTDHAPDRDAELAITSDGRYVIIGGQGSLGVWDLQTGSSRYEASEDFHAVAIDTRGPGDVAVVGARLGLIWIWDLRAGRTIHSFRAHASAILDIVSDPANGRLVTAGRDGTIRIWEQPSLGLSGTLDGLFPNVDEVVVAPGGQTAFSVYADTIVASDLVQLRHLGSLSFDFRIASIAVTSDGTRLAVGDESGSVHVLSLAGEPRA